MSNYNFNNTQEKNKKNAPPIFEFDNVKEENEDNTLSIFDNSGKRNGKEKTNWNRRYFAIAGGFLLFIISSYLIIASIGSNRHQNHLTHVTKLLNNSKVIDAVEYYNEEMFKDSKCQQKCLSSLCSFAMNTFSNYIAKQSPYEEAKKTLQELAKVNDDTASFEINNLLLAIEQIEMTSKENNNQTYETEQRSEVKISDQNENKDNIAIIETKFLDNCTILEADEYQGNQGDSFVYPIGQHQYTRGRCDISGKTYYHGIEAWIARWDYEDEISWAYSVFELPEHMNSLTGRVVLINSINTTNFDSTLYFINADTDTEIKSYHLTPDTIPFDFSVSISGIQKLKIFVTDNRAVSGGTSFGLINATLSINEIVNDNSDQNINDGIQKNIPSNAYVWNGHSYFIYSDADSWIDAEAFCNSKGGYLAVITSKEENDAVFQYLKNQNLENAYFGLTDREIEGIWKWVNGTDSDYTNWHTPTEPNAENSNEDYAMFYYKYPDGTWNDGDFSGSTVNGEKYFICEWDSQ